MIRFTTRDQFHCRRCELSWGAQTHAQAGGAQALGRRPFSAIPGTKPQYAPDIPFKLEHITLDLTVDPKQRIFKGTAIQKLKAVAPGKNWLKLDQIGLKIDEVKVGDRVAKFHTEGHALHIQLADNPDHAPKPQDLLEVAIRYQVNQPRRGLYFSGPDADYPTKHYQAWTQGQDEDSRYWFPTLDYPNQKATSEIIATVPKGFTAISNGALLKKENIGEQVRFHYKLGTPHVTYLISLVVGEFAEGVVQGPRGLPVQFFVPIGKEADGERAFGNTPDMIEAFEKKIGVHYPYEKYSQVAVQDFIFGGMENTSATTQTDTTLHDERAHIDFSSDPLVSHELAHQWFGDLLTCRDWSHGWLNEGFATFMERVWIENDTGPHGGMDEAKYYSFQDLKEYLEEDKNHYRRPIVCNTYIEPIDLFDRHLYQKGGLVLNLIRYVLGEELFWKTIQSYVSKHKGQNVETLDLIRAIEETTGRNLRQLFDQWVYGAGHPEFEVSYQWHEDKKYAELVIEQKQTGGQASVTRDGATTHLFRLPVVLELTLEDGKKVTQTVEISEARERVFIAAPSKPKMVRFDPNSNIPKEMKFPRPKEMLVYQLEHDTDIMGRIEAAKELVKLADPEVVAALGKAAATDKFWGVQAEAANALSEIRSNSARDALAVALSAAKNPKTRRAIAAALGTYKDPTVASILRKFAEKDESYFVEAESTHAWAQARVKPLPVSTAAEIADAEKFLIAQLGKSSYREVIRAAALRSLAELPGIGRGERPEAMAALTEFTKRGKPLDARLAAIYGLGLVAKSAVPSERARIIDLFTHLSDEDNFRIRMMLVGALGMTESPAAIGILGKIHGIEIDGRIKRDAFVWMDALRTSGTMPESVTSLKTALEKLEEEHRKIKSQLEELRGMSAAASSKGEAKA